jgi:hypothetical protein
LVCVVAATLTVWKGRVHMTEEAAMSYTPEEPEPASPILRAKRKHEALLLAIDGVEGVGVGRDRLGNDAIVVYLRDETASQRLPKHLDGFPIEGYVTGVIDAQ